MSVKSFRVWQFLKVLVGITFGLVVLIDSLYEGQLGFPTTYDNNMYMIKSYWDLEKLRGGGALALLQDWWQHPPHAPTAELSGLFGYLLIGTKDWAPSVLQISEVIGFIFLIDRLARRSSLPVRAAIVLMTLCAAPVSFLVVDLRVDSIWGLLAAGTIALLLSREGIAGELRTLALAGVLSGLALFVKPSIFPITIIMTGAGLVLQQFLYTFGIRAARRVPGTLAFFGPTIVIALPYFAIAWSDILGYIYEVVFSSHAQGWLLQPTGTRIQELLFYLTGPGGILMIGPWLWIFICVVPASILFMWLRADWIELAAICSLLLVTIVSYAVIAIPRTKSVYFGTGLAFLVIFGTVVAISYIFEHRRPTLRNKAAETIGASMLVLFGLATFHFPSLYLPLYPGLDRHSSARLWRETLSNMITAAKAEGVRNNDLVFITGIYRYVIPETISLMAWENHMSQTRFMSFIRSDRLKDYLKLMDYSSAVIALDPSTDAVDDLVPSDMKSSLRTLLANRFDFSPSVEFAYHGQTIARLFVRSRAFEGADAVSGLGPLQRVANPEDVPQSHVVRDTNGAKAKFKAQIPASGELLIRTSIDNPASPPPSMKVLVDGKQQGELDFVKSGLHYDADLLVRGNPGPVTLDILFGRPPTSLAFRLLQIVDPKGGEIPPTSTLPR